MKHAGGSESGAAPNPESGVVGSDVEVLLSRGLLVVGGVAVPVKERMVEAKLLMPVSNPLGDVVGVSLRLRVVTDGNGVVL